MKARHAVKNNATSKCVGRTASGRIDYAESVENALLLRLANKGYHGKLIAKIAGLTLGQVYTRCSQLGVCLRDYRNGKTKEAAWDIKAQSTIITLPKSAPAVKAALSQLTMRRQLIIKERHAK